MNNAVINTIIKSIGYILLAIVAIGVNEATIFAQNNNVITNSNSNSESEIVNFRDLTLEISLAKRDFVKMEPIPISIKVVNNKDYGVNGHFNMEFSHSKIKLFLGREKGKLNKVNQNVSFVIACGKGGNRLIKPKEEHTSLELLSVKLEKFFPETGNYYMQVQMVDFTGTQQIESNVVLVEIKEPLGEDLKAYNYIKSQAKPDFFFSSALTGVKEMEYFIENFQNTAYAPYVVFDLASLKVASEKTEKVEEAILYLEELLGKKDFALKEKILSHLIKANLSLNKVEKAKGYLKELRRSFPNSRETERSNAILFLENSNN